MSEESLRKVCLNALLVVLLGLLAGFPMIEMLKHEIYGQPGVSPLPGDYRAWRMAHLEGVLNGMLMLGIAFATRLRPLAVRRDKALCLGLILMGWGNVVGSVAAALAERRGMVLTGIDANSIVMAIFTVGFVGTLMAFWIAVGHLLRRI